MLRSGQEGDFVVRDVSSSTGTGVYGMLIRGPTPVRQDPLSPPLPPE